jgi:hypothetical protein
MVDRLLAFAWNQWAHLGVAAHMDHKEQRAADPEALLLLSLEVGRHDPRLFDEVLDWGRLNGSLLSTQRLRTLCRGLQVEEDLVGAFLDWTAAQNPSLPWARASKRDVDSKREGRDLFLIDLDPIFVERPDPTFLRHSYRRPIAKPSLKSIEPLVRRPSCLALRLRQLFGVGVRAEALRHLLTNPEQRFTAHEVSETAAYARRNVHEALTSLEKAGVLLGSRQGNERVYALRRRAWEEFLLIPPGDWPDFMDWIRLFRATLGLFRWSGGSGIRGSEYLRESRTRELVDHLAPDLTALGLLRPPLGDVHGSDFFLSFDVLVEQVLLMLEGLDRPM